jgi:hypothetical protein
LEALSESLCSLLPASLMLSFRSSAPRDTWGRVYGAGGGGERGGRGVPEVLRMACSRALTRHRGQCNMPGVYWVGYKRQGIRATCMHGQRECWSMEQAMQAMQCVWLPTSEWQQGTMHHLNRPQAPPKVCLVPPDSGTYRLACVPGCLAGLVTQAVSIRCTHLWAGEGGTA